MKRTEAQIEASRRNGAKSRGPVTIDGKLRSGQRIENLVHSLALKTEDKAALRAILQEFHDEHQPVGITERTLVEKMAIAVWQHQRFLCVERTALNMQIDIEVLNPPQHEQLGAAVTAKAAQTLSATGGPLPALNKFQTQVDRLFHRSLKMLLKLQDRRGAQPNPPAPVPFEEPTPIADQEPNEIVEPTAAAEPNAEPEQIAASAPVFCINFKSFYQPTHDSLETKEDSLTIPAEPEPQSRAA